MQAATFAQDVDLDKEITMNARTMLVAGLVAGLLGNVVVLGGCVPGLGRGKGPLAQAARERLVARLDANKDGVVDAAELEPLRDRIEELRERVRAELLTRFDADGDGKLSAPEREAAWTKAAERFEDVGENAVAKFDADKNGELNAAELAAAFDAVKAKRGITEVSPRMKEGLARVRERALDRYDADKSGGLNRVERETMRTELLAMAKDAVAEAAAKAERGEKVFSDEQVLAWLNGKH